MRDLTDRDLERLFELDDGPGPACPIDEPRAQTILAAALGRAGFSPPGGGRGGGGAGAGAAARAGVRAKLAVVSGGAVVLAIAAVAWIATRSPSAPSRASASASVAPNSPALPSTTMPDDPRSPSRAPASASAAPNSAAPPSTMPPVTAPPATAPPTAQPATAPPTAQPSPPRPPRRTPPARTVDHRRPPRAQPVVATTLDDLLAQANAARAAHRWRAADALYGRVVAGGPPATLAVQTALVASASIHLEHLADPAGAARRFADALAAEPQGALAEEARWGLAEAARAQADRVRELRALDDFLAHHPGSVLAAQARARRAALGAPP